MTPSDVTLLVMAGGLGSRFGGDKQLVDVGPNGETFLDYAIRDALAAGIGSVVVVARTESEALVVTHGGVIYALEKACGEPWTRIANLAGRWIEWLDGGLALGPRIEPITDGTVPDLL